MRSNAARLVGSCTRPLRPHYEPPLVSTRRRRSVHISVAPTSANPGDDDFASTSSSSNNDTPHEAPPDARFEALGAHSSLLSVQLSASQPLYTRRGTLVSFSGDAAHALSTLTTLSPIRRLPFLIPFLYQRVTNSVPSSLLLATKAPHTSITVLDIDGRADWRLVQRTALLAWTGHDLRVTPHVEPKYGLAHLGAQTLSGRGLAALVGAGQIYRVRVSQGESYIAHPNNVVAYTAGRKGPAPFRFRSTSLRLQVPDLGRFLPSNVRFFRDMRETAIFRALANALFIARTWLRRTIWGDRLFMRFTGPATVLLQSRNAHLRDVLTDADVNEIADAPAGALQAAVSVNHRPIPEWQLGQTTQPAQTQLRYATVKDGDVSISDAQKKA